MRRLFGRLIENAHRLKRERRGTSSCMIKKRFYDNQGLLAMGHFKNCNLAVIGRKYTPASVGRIGFRAIDYSRIWAPAKAMAIVRQTDIIGVQVAIDFRIAEQNQKRILNPSAAAERQEEGGQT